MSCIRPLYTGADGLYCAVYPITDVPPPVITSPAELEWDPVPPGEYHATICYDASARVSREQVEKWLERNGIGENSVYAASTLPTPQWWVNGGKVYLGAEMYSPALFGLHTQTKSMGVTSSYPDYKCHLTYGCWRGIPPALHLDRMFMNNFVKTMVQSQVPNIIEFSLLRIENAKN